MATAAQATKQALNGGESKKTQMLEHINKHTQAVRMWKTNTGVTGAASCKLKSHLDSNGLLGL